MKRFVLLLFLVSPLLFRCTDCPPGMAIKGGQVFSFDNKPFSALTLDERQAFCQWVLNLWGGPHEEQCSGGGCGSGGTARVVSVAECVASFDQSSNECLVSSTEQCYLATQGDACEAWDKFLSSQDCISVWACALVIDASK